MARGRMTLSGFRANPEAIVSSTESGEQRRNIESGQPLVTLHSSISNDDHEAMLATRKLERERERVAGDPLVQETIRVVAMIGTMAGKPEVVARLVHALGSIRRRLNGLEMRVMGASVAQLGG